MSTSDDLDRKAGERAERRLPISEASLETALKVLREFAARWQEEAVRVIVQVITYKAMFRPPIDAEAMDALEEEGARLLDEARHVHEVRSHLEAELRDLRRRPGRPGPQR